ncbi:MULTISPECIES: DUF4411 family protein [Lacticaseibacillus]|uniref:DUF4411 family protein n=4 Tax=Lacticaseibacillus TaxID=2759736 RepID=A0AAN1KFI1_LACCA|nr:MULTISPECIES: DUF4411 family protein [Lacticaseibacillus]ARY92783.1 hypothetical protein BGL52_13840 [Lacticaseibacillus casei]KAB1970192.1 DUF4411 family protein [Lacticaseibacillus casei]MDE3283773.1 DUF4411 family protein [Lacticaseibacillus casei]MDG3062511.1 DUF4411 family protein [Lacticaseibacillus sp. BCRC 81376]QVI36605.1 DUF4411 family protein [Lacticaseibacillus casei]
MNGYLLDSDIWIISNRHYRQRFFPIVWHFFLNTEHLYMLDRVYEEITTKDDELSVWVKEHFKGKTIVSDLFVTEYQVVTQYLMTSQKWTAAGYEQWTGDYQKADPWLIACALNKKMTIITNENMTGPNGLASKAEPKIPYVANQLGVATMNFWDFLANEKFIAE